MTATAVSSRSVRAFRRAAELATVMSARPLMHQRMQMDVILDRHDLKVLDSVVGLDAVDVMHNLPRLKRPAEMLFHLVTVNEDDAAACDAGLEITRRVDRLPAHRVVVTLPRTVLRATLNDRAPFRRECSPALQANTINPLQSFGVWLTSQSVDSALRRAVLALANLQCRWADLERSTAVQTGTLYRHGSQHLSCAAGLVSQALPGFSASTSQFYHDQSSASRKDLT